MTEAGVFPSANYVELRSEENGAPPKLRSESSLKLRTPATAKCTGSSATPSSHHERQTFTLLTPRSPFLLPAPPPRGSRVARRRTVRGACPRRPRPLPHQGSSSAPPFVLLHFLRCDLKTRTSYGDQILLFLERAMAIRTLRFPEPLPPPRARTRRLPPGASRLTGEERGKMCQALNGLLS